MIGIAAVVATVVCIVGLAALYAFPPAGQHRKSRARTPGRHRDGGHRGYADDDQAVDQLAELAEPAWPTKDGDV